MAEHMKERYEDSDLYRIRHSAAHVMAESVLEMFPEAKYTIGPPIEKEERGWVNGKRPAKQSARSGEMLYARSTS